MHPNSPFSVSSFCEKIRICENQRRNIRKVDQQRYSRQILFAPIGEEGQKKLSQARVAVVGMGALGTALSNHMARAGVKFLRLIDRDFVEASNLQRQMLYDETDARQHLPKVIAAKNKLQAIRSDLELEAHIADLTWRNAEELLSDVDLILDGTDNFQVRYLINDLSIKHQIPWIYGGVVGSRGMSFTIRPGKTPCLRCIFPETPAPGAAETCDTAGVIGPAVQVITAFQGAEAIKLLTGNEEACETHLRHIDLWSNHFQSLDVSHQKDEDCPACGRKQWDFLHPARKDPQEVSMCGRQSVQITLSQPLDLDILESRLQKVGKTNRNPFLLKADLSEDGHELAIFPDGRILVQGTTDIQTAKAVVARYVGI
ncbi:ThiF family adenylyltransferase [Thermoactinomyces sp. CICC 24226]|nr:ThiF family adenylyltransferase [Thermoactinomyces sp. CICC 10735]MBI0392867.1 ThiF family adenylyltransferase [Thermoactinomyces sp. CICC 24226]QBK12755.1 thiazole biosynthesis adenylyltransferase ThiF [Thermoactinomyces vulgaris]